MVFFFISVDCRHSDRGCQSVPRTSLALLNCLLTELYSHDGGKHCIMMGKCALQATDTSHYFTHSDTSTARALELKRTAPHLNAHPRGCYRTRRGPGEGRHNFLGSHPQAPSSLTAVRRPCSALPPLSPKRKTALIGMAVGNLTEIGLKLTRC